MSWATRACLQTDAEGHESDEKLRLLSDQVPLRHRNRREIIHQDQEGSNANLPKGTRFWDENAISDEIGRD